MRSLALIARKSCTILQPTALRTQNVGDENADVEGRMIPALSISSVHSRMAAFMSLLGRNCLRAMGLSSTSSISASISVERVGEHLGADSETLYPCTRVVQTPRRAL